MASGQVINVGSIEDTYMLRLAVDAARFGEDMLRSAFVGAVAIRRDGALVRARNGSSTKVEPSVHAEARVLRKAGAGAKVYVARVKRDGSIGCARPCKWCMAALKARHVASVTWAEDAATSGKLTWGKIEL